MLKTFYTTLFILFSTFSFSQTVMSIIEDSPDHNTLESLINSAGLNATLSGTGTFTVFAPTDAAFAALDPSLVATLTGDPSGKLTKALLYHVLGAEVMSSDLSDGQTATTLFGQDITVTINNMMEVFINTAQVTAPDLDATNGVVHVIDEVILPPNVTVADVVINSSVHETLEGAVIAADLAGTLSDLNSNFTVFAPTDDAFAALDPSVLNILTSNADTKLKNALLYHVLGAEVMSSDLSDGQTATTLFGQDITVTIDANGGVMINNANVIIADIPTFNGVVHVLDAVILPPNATVADVVINSDVHETLEGAVIAADLAGALSDLAGTFTVFAPTDDAFAALDPAVLNILTSNADTKLRRALLYHVLGAEVMSTDLSDGQTATTLFGQDITVTIDANGGVMINNANVAIADIQTLNGVVHVLDAVILPPNATVADVVINSPDHTTLEAAVVAAQLDGALSDLSANYTVFAPNDDAFAPVDVATLLIDPTGDLQKILQYHVLASEVFSTDLTDGQVATTLLGQDITVGIDANGAVTINGNALVIAADITTLNGVVHVLNNVLLPDLTSVKDLNRVNIKVYPNPTTDFITISLPSEMIDENVEAQLIGTQGNILQTWKINDVNASFDVAKYPSGTYFMLLKTENNYALSTVVIK
ncbi:MAG: fasciclin domain-containing protein [Saprospiraceae bacterium]|nr:fasciclin domain-containing protein [Saprospiraceae bacterium]